MSKIFLFILMIVVFLISMLSIVLFDNYFISSSLIIVNFILCFILVNLNKFSKNIINLQSLFLLGFFVFFLGRFPALLLKPALYNELYCLDFIFNYCEVESNIYYLNIILNLILISFSSAFIFTGKKSEELTIETNKISKNKILFFYIIVFFSSLVSVNSVIESVFLAINKGYMALYANQAESYQTPFMLIITTISIAAMAVLYSAKDQIKPVFFNLILSIFLLSMFLSVLTGSRSAFISSLLLIVWHIYKEKKINFVRYLILFLLSFLAIFSIDTIAALSGARPHQANENILQNVADTLYNQGITLMVFNSSLNVNGYPILGYVKTLFPGIQVIFSQFGINERYDFDWSSYMTYHENRQAYLDGYGLGWSIFSDFYILSFGILPLFCFFIFIFGRFTIYIANGKSQFKSGLLFICVLSFFSLNRASVSPLIFVIIIYIIFCIYGNTLKLKKSLK